MRDHEARAMRRRQSRLYSFLFNAVWLLLSTVIAIAVRGGINTLV